MPGPTGGDAGGSGDGSDNWTWAPALGVYHNAASGTYALPHADGWRYLSAAELATHPGPTGGNDSDTRGDKEEGEIDDDVGWGALMDPEKLARIESATNPACTAQPLHRETYADGTPTAGDPLLAHEQREGAPAHLLRLVVRRSQVLDVGSVAVLDTRRDGTQLGRDRGADARLRVKEMEVSKTHAVVFYQPLPAPAPGHPSPRRGRASRSPSPYGARSRSGPVPCTDAAPPPAGESGESGESGWFVSDLGSTLGTYVAHAGEEDATRLSEAKCASRPYALRHGDRLTVGRTTFGVHIHADWPCAACQLSGNTQLDLEDGRTRARAPPAPADADDAFELDTFAMSGNGTRKGRQALKRRREMDALRGNLLGDNGAPPPRQRTAPAGYVDRSAQRRRLHPPSPPRQRQHAEHGHAAHAAQAQEAPPAGPSETARKLLAKQGWSEGQGLGRTPGRAEPIVPVVRSERAGLGTRGQVAEQPGDAGDWRQRGRQRRWDEVAGKP